MHLFLSPHLDDAVFSCGGTIHQLTARGEPVTVLTIMAGDPPDPLPDTPIVADLHRRWQAGYNPVIARRAEDQAACQLLDAGFIHLPIGDCVYRTAQRGNETLALYPDEDSLWGDIHPDDPAPAALRAAAVPIPASLYVPLGGRHHVDHRIVRDWGLWLGRQYPAAALFLYEEYPYESDATMELERALVFYESRNLSQMSRQLGEADVAARLGAMACYQSQISTFWDSVAQMEASTRKFMYAAANGGYAERFWQIRESDAVSGS